MADSLQEQLRALGLAGKQQDERKRQKPGKRKAPPAAKPAGPPAEMSLDEAWALREKEEQRQAEQGRQKKLEEERRRREINAAVRAIVEPNRLNRTDAEIARNFMFRDRIRKVYVSAEQQQALNEGRLGIVYFAGGYHLLALEHLDAVGRIDRSHVVDLAGANEDEDGVPVPDDLVW